MAKGIVLERLYVALLPLASAARAAPEAGAHVRARRRRSSLFQGH